MKYKVLLFDADETLFDFDKSEAEAFHNTMQEYGIDAQEDLYFQVYKELNRLIWKELEDGLITLRELKVERFRRFLEKQGIEQDEYEFAACYMKHLGGSSILLDGAKELIEDLSGCYRMAIVTNGLTSVQERRIRKSVIAKYFDEIIISEELGVSKPEPGIYEHAVNAMGNFAKKEVLMIGDNLNSDIKGGINYGVDTCWFNPKRMENKTNFIPDYEVFDFTGLRELLLR